MFKLTATKVGTGSGYVGGNGGIDCGPTCTIAVAQGTSLTLLAVPDNGSAFSGWSGACSGSGNCTVTVNADTAVTARFDDHTPPQLKTLPGSTHRGGKALLRYRVFDNSGKSREQLTVWNGTTRLALINVPLSPVVYRHVYSAPWRVPSHLTPGLRRFCAIAFDPAGNRSRRSCSALAIT
jgi:hypothetical protein